MLRGKSDGSFPWTLQPPAPKSETQRAGFMDFETVVWLQVAFLMFAFSILKLKNRDKHDYMQGSCIGSTVH